MAQGLLKKAKPATTKPNRRPAALGPKRMGAKVIAPKNATLIKQQKITKKLTAGLVGKTERNLAAKAGHLELLAGGKKDKKKADQAKADKAKGQGVKKN